MGYTLQAILAHEPTLRTAKLADAAVIVLGHGIAMIPLTETLRDAIDLSFCPLTGSGNLSAERGLFELCLSLSAHGKLAYVGAEYFGGTGKQASVLFENGEELTQQDSINVAIRFLGVSAKGSEDEFDLLGLGQKRHTDDWVEHSPENTD